MAAKIWLRLSSVLAGVSKLTVGAIAEYEYNSKNIPKSMASTQKLISGAL